MKCLFLKLNNIVYPFTCFADEIYRTVLTVYAFDADYTYPTRNEVLISSARTTVEEVSV